MALAAEEEWGCKGSGAREFQLQTKAWHCWKKKVQKIHNTQQPFAFVSVSCCIAVAVSVIVGFNVFSLSVHVYVCVCVSSFKAHYIHSSRIHEWTHSREPSRSYLSFCLCIRVPSVSLSIYIYSDTHTQTHMITLVLVLFWACLCLLFLVELGVPWLSVILMPHIGARLECFVGVVSPSRNLPLPVPNCSR